MARNPNEPKGSAHLFRSTQNWPHLRNARCSVPKNLLSLSKRRPQTDIFDVACNPECGRQYSYRPNAPVCCNPFKFFKERGRFGKQTRNKFKVLHAFEKDLVVFLHSSQIRDTTH